MANAKIFTLPLVAGQTYVLDNDTSSQGITIINDVASAANITILGTGAAIINGILVTSAAISLAPSESISLTANTPLSLTIVVGVATSGKLILIS